jgi:hypothetical protein
MKKKLLPLIVLIVSNYIINAATITNSVSGTWSSPSIWTGGVVPGATDDVIIRNGSTVTLDANYTCLSLSIDPGVNNSTLDLNGFTFNVTNTITINAPTVNSNLKRIIVGTGILNSGQFL